MENTVRRGIWLSGFLILALVASLAGITSYFLTWQEMNTLLPAWAHYCLLSIALLRPASIIAIWFWSRSGVVAYALLSFLALIVLLANKNSFSLIGLVGMAILVAVVWSKWKYMSWGFSLSPMPTNVTQTTVQDDSPASSGPAS